MKAKKIASQETCFYFDEIWKDIQGYEGLYQISNYGRIKGLSKISKWNNRVWKEKILKQRVVKQYKQIFLYKDGIGKEYKVHRLVAQAFLPNPDNLPQVNHKDGNKLNNNVSNLEWISARDNQLHSVYVLGNGKFRPIEQYDKEGNFIREWEQIRIASNSLNIDESAISKCCKQKRMTAGGYIWKYKEEQI